MDIFISVFSFAVVFLTVIPLIKQDYWTFRVFDYPRLQKLVLSTIALTLVLLYFQKASPLYWLLLTALVLNNCYLLFQIYPFTFFAKKQVLTAINDKPEQSIGIMIANVYEDNTNTSGCLKEIYTVNPDVVLLLETNKRWETQTNRLEADYPHHVKVPLENTYGMLLYSKLPLNNVSVKYMVEKDIPSIHCQLTLRNGQTVQLYAIHPTPPVPNENPRSTERDKELLLVADLAKACKTPVIVIGDLNDVAWSYTTELFLKMSGLLDPRRGRGFLNTFHAHYPFMRFPLDHAFISTDFKLKEMKRLPNFDSDHFPIFLSLQYEANASRQQHSLSPETEDVKEAEEKKTKR